MRISDWSSDVCSSDLTERGLRSGDYRGARGGGTARLGQYIFGAQRVAVAGVAPHPAERRRGLKRARQAVAREAEAVDQLDEARALAAREIGEQRHQPRSEEHTSELQSLMRISYGGFCLKKKSLTITDMLFSTAMRQTMTTTREARTNST